MSKYNQIIKIFAYLLFSIIGLISCSSVDKTVKEKGDQPSKEILSGIPEADTSYIKLQARTYFIDGARLMIEDKNAEAALEFQMAQRYDSSAVIDYALAKAYLGLNKSDLALESINKSVAKDSLFVPSLEMLMEFYLMKYDIPNAVKIINKLISIEPTRERKLVLARLYEFNEIDKAIHLYETLNKQNKDINVSLRLAELYKLNKQNEDLKNILNDIIDLSTDNYEATVGLIDIYLNESDYNNVYKVIDKSINVFQISETAQVYFVAANKLLIDTTENAKLEIPKLLERIDNKFYPEWRLNFFAGALAESIEDTVKSEMYYTRALKVADSIPDLPLQIAYQYIRNEKNDEGIKLLKRYVQAFPTDNRFNALISEIYSFKKDYVNAIKYCQAAYYIDTTDISMVVQLGLFWDMNKNKDSSDYWYKKGMELAPNNLLLNNNYAYSLSERGLDLDKAEKMSRFALDSSPDNISYMDTYGYILYKQGRYKEALTYIEKASLSTNSSAEVFEHLGDIYIELGNKEKAVEYWNKALELNPDLEQIKNKLKLIK